MTSRTIHIGASFAIVLVAYWTYALLALPWIETPVTAAARHDAPISAPPSTLPDQELAVLFPPNSWEIRDAKVISSNDQVLLLWKTYANHANGWVDLNPLTIVFVPAEPEDDSIERMRHAVVMEVPGGANLHFDRPLDLNRGGLGRLIEGRLRGQVKIRGRGKRPDHQDDLLVLTHDVDLTEQRITTPNEVEFWFGPNSGCGRELEMKLLPRLGPGVANQEGPNIGGIEQIQLMHVERLHLQPAPPLPAAPGNAAPPPAAPGMMGSLASGGGPIEITCLGPFRFHLVDQVATFRDHVDVRRTHAGSLSDHLTCDRLSIYFTRPAHPAAAAKGKPSAPGFDLQPARIEALGTSAVPTVLNAPLDQVQVRAERLEYNLIDGQFFLKDPQEALLQKERNEIHTQSLLYVPGPQGHTNRFQLVAGGPGWLRGEMADRPGQQLEARWQAKLEVRPQGQNQVVSLTGGASLDFQAMGQLNAQEIHFWLSDAPPPRVPIAAAAPAAIPGQTNFQPDRLLALGNVVGKSPQFSSNVDRLEVWFTNAPPSIGNGARSTGFSRIPGVPAEAGTTNAYVPSTAAPATSPLGMPGPAAVGGRQSHLEITGRLLQARVLRHDQQQSDLTEVTVVDRVHLQETQTAQPGDLPLLITGQWLHATEANSPQAKITVLGKPAHLEGRGMSLTGPSIVIDRGANLLTMDGAGQMEKFLDRDLENHPLSQPGRVRIDWLKGMTFDGRKAHFQDGVKVNGQSQLLETASLDVCFQHPVSFSQAQPQEPALVETLHCDGGVSVVNRTLEAGQQTSLDRIWVKNLDMNNLTGDFHADGPGRVISVRRGGGGPGLGLPGGPLAGSAPLGGAGVSPASFRAGGTPAPQRTGGFPAAFAPGQPPPADPNQLTCLDLRFMNSITGNKKRNVLEFHGQVRAARAVVQSWSAMLDDDDPKRLGPDSVVLYCENLEVADMGPVSGSGSHGGNQEFQARDNVIAEGTNFTARCARLSYSQAKDQLIFEGDGRSDAELYKQEAEGKKVDPFKAQKIIYFQKTGQVNVDGFRSLETNQAPSKPAAPARR